MLEDKTHIALSEVRARDEGERARVLQTVLIHPARPSWSLPVSRSAAVQLFCEPADSDCVG